MSTASIVAQDVCKQFSTANGPLLAVDRASLSIAPGEFVVIVGPSGCGKSTLLRMMAGLESPTGGSLALTRADGSAATNAMVFHGRTLLPWLTVRRNIGYGLRMAGASGDDIRKRTDELLALTGLTPFASSWPHQLSEGMRQRVSIARALAVEPDVLLMDEPFGALDEQTRFLMQEELLRIWEATGSTIVFVTHSIDEALTMADRILIMSARPGTIRESIEVPFPRPRSLTDVRHDARFADLFSRVWEILRADVVASGAFRA